MYTPLYVKSNYSFYESLVKIDELIKTCKERDIKEIALTDENMISTMYFYSEAIKNDIKPVIGLELKINEYTILLYAKNYKGYQNLIKINTEKNNLELNDIKQYLGSIIVILPFNSKEIHSLLDIDDLYIGFSSKGEEKELSILNLKTVFINKVLYINKKEEEYFKYLIMLKEKKSLSDGITFSDDLNYLLDYEDALDYSSKNGLDESIDIAKMCNLEFPKKHNVIPKFENKYNLPSDKYLTNLSIAGLTKRLNNDVSDIYRERLLYELDIINKMGFSDYFLIVYDYVRYAKKSNILVGPGRGSAGGSLVAYSLGIIDVDPLQYDLLFERFLNPGRVTMPDIDIDFPDIYREDIIKYTREKYGIKKVAGIVTIGTLRARSAVDEISKILNVEIKKIDIIKRYLDNNTKLSDVYNNNEEFKNIIDNDDSLKKLLKISLVLEGFPRNISIHASGIVISSDDLDTIIPLIKVDDFYITSYEMEYLENIGLLKMDFLGNRNLTTIMDTIECIKDSENKEIDFQTIPLDDKKTIDLFNKIDTDGIFHFESDAMKNLLTKLKIECFNDIVLADSLVRPGPDSKTYLERRNNNVKVSYPNDEIKKVLEETYGVLVYQEQIMRLVSIMAGFDLQSADLIRRAMTKNNVEELKHYKEKFIEGSLKNGYTLELSNSYYEDILNFAKYGFNKAHAVPYSLIAYKMGYLKANYPKCFYLNILSLMVGNDNKTYKIIQEAKKRGINFFLPDINKSGDKFLITEKGILFPISNIKAVGNIITNEIVKIRKDGFKDIFECFSKLAEIGVNKKTIENLIYTSCFDSLGYNKNTLIENLDNLFNYAQITKGMEYNLIEKPEIIIREEFSSDILMSKEKELLGFYLSYHPVTKYKEDYKVISLENVEKYIGKEIDAIILVERVKLHIDKNNNKMAFLIGSDEISTLDFTFFSKVFETVKDVKRGDILLIRGKVEKKGRVQILVNRAKILN